MNASAAIRTASPGRDVLYTGIWNTLIALFLAAANMLFNDSGGDFSDVFIPNLIISNVVGYMIHAVLMISTWLLRGWPATARGMPRIVYCVTLICLCVAAGIALGDSLLRGTDPLRFVSRM